jgi:hypothetical protein
MDIKSQDNSYVSSKPTEVVFEDKAVTPQKVVVAEKKELSENIKAFDERVRKVYTENPYDYNTISLKKEQKILPSAQQMVTDPTYNTVGKMLGLDTAKEWNLYYDKIFHITEWALTKTDKEHLFEYIAEVSRTVPSMGSRRIDDIFIHAKISK